MRSGEKKTVEGRKTGIDFLSYENYNEDVEEYEQIWRRQEDQSRKM